MKIYAVRADEINKEYEHIFLSEDKLKQYIKLNEVANKYSGIYRKIDVLEYDNDDDIDFDVRVYIEVDADEIELRDSGEYAYYPYIYVTSYVMNKSYDNKELEETHYTNYDGLNLSFIRQIKVGNWSKDELESYYQEKLDEFIKEIDNSPNKDEKTIERIVDKKVIEINQFVLKNKYK